MKKTVALFVLLLTFGIFSSAEAGRWSHGTYIWDGYIPFTVDDLTLENSTELTTSTTPGFESKPNTWGNTNRKVIVWASGETSPIVVRTIAPPDYGGNGRIIVEASQSAPGTACQVDFDVYIDRPGSSWDTSATNQTAVALSSGGAVTSSVNVELVPATDEIQPYDSFQFRIWRAAVGSADLRIGSVAFVYDPK